MIDQTRPAPHNLRLRMRNRESLRGTFIKIPHPQVVELLGAEGIDFLVLDAEHAAFDIQALDSCIMAARTWSVPALVRVPSIDSPLIAAVLDMGAQGILLPHVSTVAVAERGLRAALYHGGERGLTGSCRSGDYGGHASLDAYTRQADSEVVIIAQLEDGEALEHIGQMAKLDRVDGFFIGAADLGLSLANSGPDAPTLDDAMEQLTTTVAAAGRPLGTYVDRIDQAAKLSAQGYDFLAIGSDQTMIRRAVAAIKMA